jgi:hypothetical protein
MPIAKELANPITEDAKQDPLFPVDSEPDASTDSDKAAEIEENPPFFQAIGTLYGKPHLDDDGKFWLHLGTERFALFIPGPRYRPWLRQLSSAPDTSLFLRVYPKCLILPRKDPVVRFEVTAWRLENQWDEASGIFKFSGIWQFVPQFRTPVISVYRNRNATDPQGKFKASHLPVLMRREDEVTPFKFNPKIPKEQLPKRWFIQACFKFIPSRNCWGWVEDFESPSEKIPKYRKPVKAEMGKKESD